MTVYNGTITVGDFSGVVYGYARSGNIVGLPAFGSASLDPGAPTLDLFYWASDGSAVGIFFSGNIPGAVTWNGQQYPLTYDSETDASGYAGDGLSGPYPTSGSVSFTYDSSPIPSSTYTLTATAFELTMAPQAASLLRSRSILAETFTLSVSSSAALVGPATRVLTAETLSLALSFPDTAFFRTRVLVAQSKFMGAGSPDNNTLLYVSGRVVTADVKDFTIDFPSANLVKSGVGSFTLTASVRDISILEQDVTLTYVPASSGLALTSFIIT